MVMRTPAGGYRYPGRLPVVAVVGSRARVEIVEPQSVARIHPADGVVLVAYLPGLRRLRFLVDCAIADLESLSRQHVRGDR